MLPKTYRLTTSEGFRRAVREGRRSANRALVVHLAGPEVPARSSAHAPGSPSVGFVVSKSVGNAVTRNRVQRRLRHLALDRLEGLAPGCILVVRALPAAADASYAELGADLDRALEKASQGHRR